MTDPTLPTGPDPEAIISYLTTTYPATAVVTIPAAWFFSLDAETHPVYAAQRWISILNPSWATWNETVIPLIAVAHDRLAAQRARHGLG